MGVRRFVHIVLARSEVPQKPCDSKEPETSLKNCPGFSGEQSAKQTSRKPKGTNPCQLLRCQRGLRPDRREARMLPLRASRMMHLGGARSRGAAGPRRRRQGQYQGAGAGGQGITRRQRDPEEGVGLFCLGRARPPRSADDLLH